MSILRTLRRSQPWTNSGYVCRSCRHKLLAAQSQCSQQSTSTAAQETGHDWASNFNDLDKDSAQQAKRAADREKQIESRKLRAEERLARKNERSRSGEDGGKAQLQRQWMAKEKTLPGLRKNLKDKLNQNLQDEKEAPGAPEPPERDAAPSDTPTPFLIDSNRDDRRAKLKGSSAASKKPTSGWQAMLQTQRLARETEQSASVARQNEPSVSLDAPDVVARREQMDKMVAIIQKEIGEKFGETLAAKPGVGDADVQKDETETQPIATVESGAQDVDSQTQERLEMPKFVFTPQPTPPYTRPTSTARQPRAHMLIERKREVDSRPKWGGPTSPRVVTTDPELQIRKAGEDKKSRPALVTINPWGLDAAARATESATPAATPQNTTVYADSPGELAEMTMRQSVAKTESPATPADQTPRGSGMDSLRQDLENDLHSGKGMSQPDKQATVESAEAVAVPALVDSTAAPDGSGEPSTFRIRRLPTNPPFNGPPASPPFRMPVTGDAATAETGHAAQPNTNETDDAEPDPALIDAASERLQKLHIRSATSVESQRPTPDEDSSVSESPNVDKESIKPDAPKNLGRRARYRLKRRSNDKSVVHATPSAQDAIEPSETASDRGTDEGEHKPLWQVMEATQSASEPPPGEFKSKDSKVEKEAEQLESPLLDLSSSEPASVACIEPANLTIQPLNIPQPVVPGLEYGLDRVLFNPGVYQLQDPQSRVYNFDPYLQNIMPVEEFDYNALKQYKTSSQDPALWTLAAEHNKRYIDSTSSMTSTLGHFHYLLSDFRPINLDMLSRGFREKADAFTQINRAPNAIFLRHKNGSYAIDADKEFDSANVLMMLGKSMEKLLTMPTSEFERYRKGKSASITAEERNEPESYEYTTMSDFLMRSQLDAHDSRLPGNGMFDLKTRAVVSIRMNSSDFKPMTGYEIHTLQGRYESYEREYYDMLRSTMLKYMLQARMGRMTGIFVAYHNVERIFGFQYIPIQEMDRALHGQIDPCLGDQEFKTSLELMNKIFDKATAKFPEQSLRFHFETTQEALGTGSNTTVMWIHGEPMAEQEIDRIQSTSKAKVAEFERTMMGMAKEEAVVDEPAELDGFETVEVAASTKQARVDPESSTEPKVRQTDESTQTGPEQQAKNPPDFSNSTSSADPRFMKKIEPSTSGDRSPLFVASLICKSRVNGASIERPQSLKREDKWEVEYLLQEWEINDGMWARYEQAKARRKDIFSKFRDDDDGVADDVEGEGQKEKEPIKESPYITFLKSMSQRGRAFRGKMDQLEAGKVPVVVGQPSQKVEQRAEEKIEELDDYMSWLYKERA